MLNAEQRAYLRHLSPRTRACKAVNRHPWPVIIPGEPIPPGVIVRRVSGGLDITYICPNCGRMKTESTGPKCILGSGDGKPKYSGGEENYVASGLGMDRNDQRAYYFNEVAVTIRKAAKR